MPRADLIACRWILLLAIALVFAGCEGDQPRECAGTLEGNWLLIGFSDHGVEAATTGTARFDPDGNFAILGEITFPDEPMDTLDVSGTWAMTGDRVLLTTPDGTGEWEVSFSGMEATLTGEGPEPASAIRLRRPIY